jgi:ABC-type multidrug transport system permease subunit
VSTLATLARRDLLLARSYRLAIAYDIGWGVVEVIIYFFISRVVGAPEEELGAAPSYFGFALAGILMGLVIGSATSAIAQRIREEELTGTLEMVVAQPVRSDALALGYATYPIAFALLRVFLILTLAVAFLDLSAAEADWVGVAVVMVASAAAFLGLGVVAAAATIVYKRGGTIAELGIFAMIFLGGALFPFSALPDWLEPVGRVVPTRFAFDGLRDALFAGEGWGGDVLALLAIAALAIPASLWVFGRALERAKRDGSLSQY